MNNLETDVAVIGAGAAGMSAAALCAGHGFRTLLIDREEQPGGVLLQCIHNGFGLHYFNAELTGPEFAARLEDKARSNGAEFLLDACVMKIGNLGKEKELTLYSGRDGVTVVRARAVVMAMGCRERTRGNLGIPGDRAAGIFTAGLAQRLLNMDGFLPGKSAVIVGSGDIGLIMARRLSWCGIKVKAVVEILPHPSGLSRNIAQCLDDFAIPLRLSTAVTWIAGRDRVQSVRIAPLANGVPDLAREETIECDTVLFSVGLIPETELARQCGVKLDPATRGAQVDSSLMTSVPGIFSCGNVLHVHDLVDFVAEESECCGRHVVDFLRTGAAPAGAELPAVPDGSLAYVVPASCRRGNSIKFYMRPAILCRTARLTVTANGKNLLEKRVRYVKPAEMICLDLPEDATKDLPSDAQLRFKLEESA